MRTTGCLMVIGTCAVLASAQTAQNDPAPAPQAAESPDRRPATVRSAVHMLRARLPEVRFDEAPAEQVFAFLRDYLAINVVVHWDKLADVGVQREDPVTIRARNLRLDQILWLVLIELEQDGTKLGYRADLDVLEITTAEDLGEQMITRLYDVRDLLQPRLARPSIALGRERTYVASVEPVVAAGAVAVRPITGITGSGTRLTGQDSGGTIFDDEDDVGSQRDERMRQLIDAITGGIAPETWARNGGRGTIMPFNGMLVIRNSPLVHQQLGGPIVEPDVAPAAP